MAPEHSTGFTILIPTYNSAGKIERCLSSVTEQDYPRELVQILVADGGSTDGTPEIALGYGAEVVDNPRRLAEEGLRTGMSAAAGEFLVIFADDNELVGRDWLSRVAEILHENPSVAAFWCRLGASPDDPPINHYFALIQSEPFSFFMNRNLPRYLNRAVPRLLAGSSYHVFEVKPEWPLVWGANGLTFRTDIIKPVWDTEHYLGDNDAFQIMLERGHTKVAYSEDLGVYHHHVTSLREWRSKWKRNFVKHFLTKRETRNLNWLYVPHFRSKVMLWTIYSLVPLFSAAHALFRAIQDRDLHWLYHPAAAFLQSVTYIRILAFSSEGRGFLWRLVTGRQ